MLPEDPPFEMDQDDRRILRDISLAVGYGLKPLEGRTSQTPLLVAAMPRWAEEYRALGAENGML